jgi:hypothetical protein
MARQSCFGLVIAGALLLVPAALAGQAAGTSTGFISGTVRDTTGAALPAVTIVVTSSALMGPSEAVTDNNGFFRFPTLPPGEYVLVFTREGFGTVRRERILVGVGFTATVDVDLSVAAQEAAVTVGRESPVLDRHTTALATRFDAAQLAEFPASRSMLAILSSTPAVHVGRFEVGGNNGALGSPYSAYGTSGANRPLVEGINVSGIAPTGFTLNYGSFEEVSVGTAAHSAEWSMPGVQMQFVSKSGGNQYRGTFYADYEHNAWQAFNIDPDQVLRGARGASGVPPREANRLGGYYDVNADVGGYLTKDTAWWYSSFRAQQVAARQVNLPDTPYRTNLTNYTGKGTYQPTRKDRLVAYGQVGRNHQPTRLDPFGPAGGLNASTVINESVGATTNHLAWGWVWKGEWNSVVRSNLLFEVRAGQFGADRSETPNGAAPRFEDVTTLVVHGGNRDWSRGLRRNQVIGSLSYFKDDWFGNHHVKAGGEVLRNVETDTWHTSYPGDVLHVLNNGSPQEVYLFDTTPSGAASGLLIASAYLQDSWRANRLTLNLGLRFDRYRAFLPEQQHPSAGATGQAFPAVDNLIDWNALKPRLGVAYDLSGDGQTVLKFNYGQYAFAPGVELGFNANPNASLWWQKYPWTDRNLNGVWDAGEEDRNLLRERRGGAELESLDPTLALAVLDELAGWVERDLGAGVGLRAGIVWRGEGQHFMRQNLNQPFDAFSVPVSIRDPGPDGTLGTPDDGSDIDGYALAPDLVGAAPRYVVRNVPGSDGSYLTWEVVATRRFSGRWSLVAGFAYTSNRDHASAYSGQAVRQNAYPLNPNDLINTDDQGRHEFRVWSAKAHGTYEGPWGVRVTPLLRHQSGQPFGRTFTTRLNYGTVRILAEPMGTRRMDHLTVFDVRVEKGFRLGGARRIAGFVDVFNVLNANPEQNMNWGSVSFLRPISIVAPRIARVGVKFDW